MTISRIRPLAIAAALVLLPLCMPGTIPLANAAYGNIPETHLDPSLLRVDEKKFLGEKVASDFEFVDQDGKAFKMSDILGKPTILVLSYFSCDGACPTINRNLATTLDGVDRWKIGEEYRVLTVSFDPHDDSARLHTFMKHAGFLDTLPQGWKMAVLKNPERDISRLAGTVGFKYFWSPRDRMFVHPNVYIMLSPTGRVTRYLYGVSVDSKDVQISITKAFDEEISPSKFINFVLAACYSYNYQDGKYKINLPIFIGLGALMIGVILLIVGAVIMKKRRMMA